MKRIAWDMRHGLPNQAYLKFVARYLLQQESGRDIVDPFALDVPPDKVEDVYLVRENVEKEISQGGTKIILGPEGSGKTFLFRRLPRLLHNQTLVVPLPLAQIGASVPEQELMEGKISLLTAELLVHYVFGTYWRELFFDFHRRERFLPHLRRDQQWMTKLRWFHQHYCPPLPEVPGEFELMTWLNASLSREPFSSRISPEDALRELVCFVTSAVAQRERFGPPLLQPYVRLQLLIDGTECLTNLAITRLLQDAQRLHDLNFSNAQFTLFADSSLQEQIETSMDCVRQGRVKVYCLPQWDTADLRQMLSLRLKAWRQGEFAEAEYGWGRLIPETHLAPVAQARFVDVIVQEAVKIYGRESVLSYDLDAPIHALRLARGLVAACAGCWDEHGYPLPLDAMQIQALANLYWEID